MTLVIALDPGIVTGVARSDGTTSTIDLREVFARDRGEAICAFADALHVEFERDVSLLLIERPMGKLVATMLPEILAATAHSVAWHLGIPRRELTVPSIRKAVCGDARADKKAVQAAVSRAGWLCPTPHEADAVAVLLAGIEMAKKEKVA